MKEKLSLNDLSIKFNTEIEIDKDIIYRLDFDIKDLSESDVNMAEYTMLKYKNVDKLKKINKSIKNESKKINKIDIVNDKIIIDYTNLKYKSEIEEENSKEMILSYLKFIKSDMRLDNLYDYLMDIGLDIVHFEKIKNISSYYISLINKKLNDNIVNILELEDKKGTHYNSAMLDLQIAYEHMKGCYFAENNYKKAFSDWSYREQVLSRSYFTKKYMIDKASNDELEAKYKNK